MLWADRKALSVERQDIHNSDIPEICKSCEARHRGVCGALTPQQLTALSRFTKIVDVPAGTTMLLENEPIERYANILHGVVKLYKLLEDGRQQIVGLQFAPDLLGRQHTEISNVTAEAATDTRVCYFPPAALEHSAQESRSLSNRLQVQALRELDQARTWMLILGRMTAYEKVASFLNLIATASDPERDPEQTEVRIMLPLSRGEMADFLGLTTETVSRQMTALRKKGIIELERSQVVKVRDLEALSDACGA